MSGRGCGTVRLVRALTCAAVLLGLGACTGQRPDAGAPESSGPQAGSTAVPSGASAQPLPPGTSAQPEPSGAGGRSPIRVSGAPGTTPPAVVGAIRAAVDRVNATAGAEPTAQAKVLLQLVDPGQRATQQSCAAARTTVKFEPAWEGLRADPTGDAGVYLLPTLVRVYRGSRIASNDLTTLRVLVKGDPTADAAAGQVTAWLPALCVR